MSKFKAVDTSNYKMRDKVQTAADLKLRKYYSDELNAQQHRHTKARKAIPL